ncbi:MAG: hypothetical protein A2138_19200 [Deltaproteobacteria bacterium RBG_16_71_12]|nr:MAG: hypothetical protein A2138_19200 [Deltaproteobacteria bacterium RBG_16_71_12]
MAVAPSHAEPIAETTLLLNYLDARVRKDTLPPGFTGRVCVGVKDRARGGAVRWWIADFSDRARSYFAAERPREYGVAVGLDDDGARAMLGLPMSGKPMQLVAGDRALLLKFVRRYLRDVSPLQSRIGAMTKPSSGVRGRR